MRIREPAVAGMFYSDNPQQLQKDVEQFLATAASTQEEKAAKGSLDPDRIKALIIPHAGHMFSGAVAASAYNLLRHRQRAVKRIVLLGPSHRVPLSGIAYPTEDAFKTPLGNIQLDTESLQKLQSIPDVHGQSLAHQWEHSLEVHLPFLQIILGDFTLVPLVVGLSSPDAVSLILEQFIDDPETMVIISSDLSHFLTYEEAQKQDRETSDLIEARDYHLDGEQACGCHPINGLLKLADSRDYQVQLLDLRNSGDTAGPRDQVVGYGAYAVYSST